MGALRRGLLRLRSVVFRRRLEREMREEMAGHVERATARLEARGLSPDAARRQALREFGNVTWLQEEARFARGTRWLDELAADVRFALRQYGRKPVATGVIFVVLAAGMAISTLLFSYVHSYAVRPPPAVPLEADLVRLRGSQDAGVYGRGIRTFSARELLEYEGLTDHFRAVAGWTRGMVPVDAGDEPELRGLAADVTFVTPDYFAVLGVRPRLGRDFTGLDPDDPGGATVAVIGHRAWMTLFGGRPDVVGSTVSAAGVPVTIVGVAPPDFIGMHGPAMLQLWMPLRAAEQLLPDPATEFRAVARLRPGVTREAATSAARVVAGRSVAEEEASRPAGEQAIRDPSTEVVPLLAANGDPNFSRDVRAMAVGVGLLGLLVLLVACTNVSALLTGLATARRHEIATRLSLGATRARVLRQLLTESVALAVAAAAAALGFAALVFRAADRFLTFIPLELAVRWPAVLFTLAVALPVGIVFGLSPALHARRLALAGATRDSSATIVAGRGRLQRGLVVAQIALTQPLIVLLAAVLVFLMANYGAFRPTPDADRILTLSLAAPMSTGVGAREGEESARLLREAVRRVAGRVERTPGVVASAIEWGGAPPLKTYAVHPDDRAAPGLPPVVNLHGEGATGDRLRILGVVLLRGRGFGPGDAGVLGPDTPEAPILIGDDLARTLWGGADPIGRRLLPAVDTASLATTFRVVGVFHDPRGGPRDPERDHTVYLPPDTTRAAGTVLVRTAGPAATLAPSLRAMAQGEAPAMVAGVRILAEREALMQRQYRIISGGILAAGLVALFLSALGLYAVMSFAVGQRLREIAVRIAIGGHGRRIVRQFLGDGLRLSILGLILGLPLSILGLHFLDARIGDVSVSLPAVTAIAAAGVLAVAALAVALPARRAAAVDPAVTLRGE